MPATCMGVRWTGQFGASSPSSSPLIIKRASRYATDWVRVIHKRASAMSLRANTVHSCITDIKARSPKQNAATTTFTFGDANVAPKARVTNTTASGQRTEETWRPTRSPQSSAFQDAQTVTITADTCAVLASVFPLALLTIVLEIRGVHFNLRRRPFFRQVSVFGMSASLIGIVMSVVGVAVDGFAFASAVIVWILFVSSMASLITVAMGILATEEDAIDKKERKRAKS